MISPADRNVLLDRLDGELADLGARLARVRGDLGALRNAEVPTTVAVPPPPPPAGLGPWAPWPAPAAVGAGVPGAPPPPPPGRPAPSPRPPAPPAPPTGRPGPRLPRITGARLLAVTGAAVTLVGVVLLLVLAASRGWFGAEARVVLGGLIGLGLVGAGVALQVRRARSGASDAAADPGPVSLAATGITALYLTVAAAASLYHLLPAAVALVLALLVAGGGLALADRWRRHGLALGVVVGAGLLLPLVVEAPGALLVALFVVLVVATLPVAARRGWPALVAVAVAGAALEALYAVAIVFAVVDATSARAVLLAVAVGALVLVAAVAAVVLAAATPAEPAETDGPARRAPGAVVAAGLVLALPVLPLLAVAGSLDRPAGAVVDVAAVLVLLGVGALLERGAGRVAASPVTATVAAAAAAVVGIQAIPLALGGAAQGGAFLAVATVLAVVARGSRRTGVLVAAGVFAAIGAVLALVRDLPVDVVVDGVPGDRTTMLGMAAVGVLLAAAAASLLLALGRLGHLGTRNRSAVATALLGLLGLYGAAGLVVTLALAASPSRSGFLVGHVLVTISWTALALVLLVRGPRPGVSLPRVLGGVLVVAAVAKLVLFDLVALDGPARVAVFLGAGLVLLGAAIRDARWVGSPSAGETVSEGPGTLSHHE